MSIQTESRLPAAELLSQEQIERLLVQVAEEESRVTLHKLDGSRLQVQKDSLQPANFGAPPFLPPADWRRFRAEHEQFALAAAAALSNHLRLDLSLRLRGLDVIGCGALLQKMEGQAHIALFRLEPLRGIGLLNMPPVLGLAFVDRLMGGAGQVSAMDRELSEVEIALLDQTLHMILETWCQRWTSAQSLKPIIIGHEVNSRYLRFASPDCRLIAATVEIDLAGFQESFTLAFPCAMLEPLASRFAGPAEPEARQPVPAPSAPPKWNKQYADLKVPLSAEWPGLVLSARKLASIKPGDIVEWNAASAAHISLRVAGVPKFAGRLGVKGGKWAVEINHLEPQKKS